MADSLPYTLRFSARSRKCVDVASLREFDYAVIGSRDYEAYGAAEVLEGDSWTPVISNPVSELPDRRGWISPVPYIRYDPDLSERLLAVVRGRKWFEDGDFESAIYDELPELDDVPASTLHAFLVDLAMYTRGVRVEDQLIENRVLLVESLRLGPAFAKTLDKVRDYALAIKGKKNFLQDGLDPMALSYFERGKANRVQHVGDLYRPNMLFHWWPECEPLDEYVLRPVKADAFYVDLFRSCAERYLSRPDLLLLTPPEDITALADGNTKNNQGYSWQTVSTEIATTRGRSRLVYIPRELKGARAAVVEDVSSANRIRLIEASVARIVETDPRSAGRWDNFTLKWTLQRKFGLLGNISKDKKSQLTSYCRDFEKEGLTKPRYILHILLDILHRRFPTWSAFSSPDFFDVWDVDIQGQTLHTLRGHGLGMANALTSLMQFVIEDMALELGAPIPRWSAYHNDDAAMIFETASDAIEYRNVDLRICKGLSLCLKAKKTFISQDYVVLCEQHVYKWSKWFSDKTVYKYQEFGNLFKAVNVCHARSLANNSNAIGIPEAWLAQVFLYWGWVLYRNEWNQPVELGGWFRKSAEHVDLSLVDFDADAHLTQQQNAGYWAYKRVQFRPQPWGRKDKYPSKYRAMGYDSEFLATTNLDEWVSLKNRFAPSRSPWVARAAWRTMLRELRIQFSNGARHAKDFPITFAEVYHELEEKYPTRDILPPKGCWRLTRGGYEIAVTADHEFCNPYFCPTIDDKFALWKEDPEAYPLRVTGPARLTIGFSRRDGGRNAWDRVQRLREHFAPGGYSLPATVWNMYLMPPEETFGAWIDPFAVSVISDRLVGQYAALLPDQISPTREQLIQARDRYFGRRLTSEEWVAIGSLNAHDVKIVRAFLPQIDSGEMEFETLLRILRQKPGLGRLLRGYPRDAIQCHPELISMWSQIEKSRISLHAGLQDEKQRPVEIYEFNIQDPGNWVTLSEYNHDPDNENRYQDVEGDDSSASEEADYIVLDDCWALEEGSAEETGHESSQLTDSTQGSVQDEQSSLVSSDEEEIESDQYFVIEDEFNL